MLTPNHSILEHNLFELFHDMGYSDVWCEGVNVLLPLINKEDDQVNSQTEQSEAGNPIKDKAKNKAELER